jgi:hypothetical protein
LGGVFIIDTSGKVAYAHIAADAADHPSPQAILQAAATLGGKVDARGQAAAASGASRQLSPVPQMVPHAAESSRILD